MARPDSPLVHPTALVSPDARLAPDVRVGPFAVIDGPVVVGPGCTVGPHAHLIGRLTLGANNAVGTGCVLGGAPQHLGYRGEDTPTVVGDNNVFREHVTVHRGMPGTPGTVIGSHNLFMVNSHVAHDGRVGNHCVFANGAVIGGHAVIHDRAFLSGNTCVHQFCRVGRLAMISGTSSISQDLPPFWIVQGAINVVRGVNLVGLRRAGFSRDDIAAVRTAYRYLNRERMTVKAAVARIEAELSHSEPVRELVRFIHESKRGICVVQGDADDGPDLQAA